jgi:transcriptional regulator with XRE-family HTH domain
MGIGERVLHLRKEVLKISQEGFGKSLGITKGSISKIEAGLNNPSSAIVTSICREYNVNEEWLRNGTGEMFKPDSDDLDYLVGMHGDDLTDAQRALMITILKMDDKQRDAVDKFLADLVSFNKS